MTKDEVIKQAIAIIDDWENRPLYEFKRSNLNSEYGTVSGYFASYILKADEKGCGLASIAINEQPEGS